MPCRDYSEHDRISYQMSPDERILLDKLTRMLCATCKVLDHEDALPNAEVKAWWAAHQKADRARRKAERIEKARNDKQEALRKSALAKLTSSELKAIRGVDYDNDEI